MRLFWICIIFSAALQAQNGLDWSRFSALKEQGALEEALGLIRESKAPPSLRLAREEQELLFRLSRYEEAQQAGTAWIRLAEESGDRDELLDALEGSSRSFASQDEKEPESQLLRRAAELARSLGKVNRELEILIRLATLEAAMGKYSSAAPLLDRAAAIWREEQDGVLEARLQAARAGLMFYQNRWQEALPYGEQALRLARREGLKELEKAILANLAQIYVRLHRYYEALDASHRSLELAADVRSRSITLATIGICHFELNQFDKAAAAFEEVLRLTGTSGNRNLEAWALGELGLTVWRNERDAERALAYFDKSVDLYLKTRDLWNALVFMGNKAMVLREMGRFREALELYRKVEARTREFSGRDPPPNIYKNIGQCLAGLGRFDEAESTLQDAIRQAEATGDTMRVWQGSQALAKVFIETGRIDEAEHAYERALESIESVRESLQLEAFKTDFFTDKIQVYQEYADLLLNFMGNEGPRLSFEVAERASARSLLDALAESKARVHETLPAEVLGREKSLLETISMLQGQIRDGQSSAEVQSDLRARQEELDRLYLRVRAEHRAFAELRYPRPAGLSAIQKALRADELLLKYQIGETASYLWLVDSAQIRHRRLPGRKELEAAVQKVFAELVTPGNSSPSLDELAEVLLPEPSWDNPEVSSLIIVPSGILFYLPFEILPVGSGSSPLVGSYRTVYVPSASFLVELRQGPPRGLRPRLLALGDPQYEGADTAERIGTLISAGELGAIPHTRAEVATVRNLFGRSSATVLLGPRATEDALKAQQLARYSVLHLAAHGVIDASMASRSALILGRSPGSEEDGILQVSEVLRLPLNANLVTLSACQSALGKLITGEGMVGLTRAFLYAGADTIVATLWNVNDEASAQFMAVFYGLLKEGHSKSEALRRAKISLRQDRQLSHPYFWAPYVLIGEGSDTVEFPADWTWLWLSGVLAVLLGAPLWWILRHRFPGSVKR